MSKYLTVDQAAQELDIGAQRVRDLINGGRLKAEKFGRAWMIAEKDLDAVRDRNSKGGRPKKNGM